MSADDKGKWVDEGKLTDATTEELLALALVAGNATKGADALDRLGSLGVTHACDDLHMLYEGIESTQLADAIFHIECRLRVCAELAARTERALAALQTGKVTS